jgi:c(7)-type cytochrome triheme protein
MTNSAKRPSSKFRRRTAVVLIALLVGAFIYGSAPSNINGETVAISVEPAEPFELRDEYLEPDEDYTETAEAQGRFSHSTTQHARMPCLLCHTRENNSPRPTRSGHIPCASCHVQEFTQSSGPMCNTCHTSGSRLKPFPPLRSFNARFDHGRHLRQTNCSTCHKPTRGGAGLSQPTGASAHASCFQCHGPRTEVGGRNIGSCATCHQPGRPPARPRVSKAYSANFSHRKHGRGGRVSCNECHTVIAGAPRGRQVRSPVVSNHFAPRGATSCMTCHNNKKAFGGDDPKDCKLCHTGPTFRF